MKFMSTCLFMSCIVWANNFNTQIHAVLSSFLHESNEGNDIACGSWRRVGLIWEYKMKYKDDWNPFGTSLDLPCAHSIPKRHRRAFLWLTKSSWAPFQERRAMTSQWCQSTIQDLHKDLHRVWDNLSQKPDSWFLSKPHSGIWWSNPFLNLSVVF